METLKATGDPWDTIFAPEVRVCHRCGRGRAEGPVSHFTGSELPHYSHGWHEQPHLGRCLARRQRCGGSQGFSRFISLHKESIWYAQLNHSVRRELSSSSAPDITAASAAWDILFKYHGRPSGVFGADEYLAGLEAVRGCVIPCCSI